MPACTQDSSHFLLTAAGSPGCSIMAPLQEAGGKCRLSSNPGVREARPLTPKEKDSRPLVFSGGILLETISTPGSFVLQGRNRQWSKHCNLFSSHKEKVTIALPFILQLQKEHTTLIHGSISAVSPKRSGRFLWGVK